MKLEEVLKRGTRASQPAANTVAEGSLYFVTDEGVTEQSISAAWVAFSGLGTGDVVGPASSVDSEVALYSGVSGVIIKRATGTGVARVTAGVWGTPGNVVESEITLADNTTNDVSTTKHGLTPKAPNDATKFLDGTGGWSVPPAPVIMNGRISGLTATPVPITDLTALASIYYTPCQCICGSVFPITTGIVTTWTGSKIRYQSFTEKTWSVAMVSGSVGDLFIKDSDLSLTFEYWKNSTVTMTIASPCVVSWAGHGLSNGDSIVFATSGALPTGLTAGMQYFIVNKTTDTFQLATSTNGTAINTSGTQSGTHTAYVIGVGVGNTTQPRTNVLALVGNILLVSGADNTFTYLGTVRASGTNTVEYSASKRFIWNTYNQIKAYCQGALEITDSWTYNTLTWRQANNATSIPNSNKFEFVQGFNNSIIDVFVISGVSTSGTLVNASTGVGINSIITPASQFMSGCGVASGSFNTIPSHYSGYAGLGANYAAWLEIANTTATVTWYGDFGSPTYRQNGIWGYIFI